MAASLAAAIERELGMQAQLVEGHGGIYEIALDGKTLYSNQSQCSQPFPTEETILAELGQPHASPVEGVQVDTETGPCCAWPPAAPPGQARLAVG